MTDTTVSRRLARWLSRFGWYCRREVGRKMKATSRSKKHDDVNVDYDYERVDTSSNPAVGPDLDKGWDYFERVTLPRHYKPNINVNEDDEDDDNGARDIRQRAEPGETKPTQLYSVWSTPEEDLGDFGIGIGLYFSTLRLLAIVTFIAGLILLPNMIYFASDAYHNDNHNDSDSRGQNIIYDSSAICLDKAWAPCPTCTIQQWDHFPITNKRLAFTKPIDVDDDQQQPPPRQLIFILVNYCNVTERTGLLAFLSLAFVFLSILLLNTVFRRRYLARFDESQQTSSDYTLQITNPPPAAADPDEWRDYFQNDEDTVVGVTVALDNRKLTEALVRRRKCLYDLEVRLPTPESVKRLDVVGDPTAEKLAEAAALAWPLAWWERLYFMSTPKDLVDTVHKMDGVIDKIVAKLKRVEEEKKKKNDKDDTSSSYYDVSSVFVTFDTEDAQRRAIESLTTKKRGEDSLFRGKHRLRVIEPKEPGAVRWLDLADSAKYKLKQLAITTTIHIMTIIVGCIIVFYIRKNYGPSYAALAITCLNSMVPTLCGYLVSYESHAYEGAVQISLYAKVTVSLWIQTAIITAVITPFTESLSNGDTGIIHSLFAIYAFEIVRGPAMQIVDIYGHVQRHFFAPRAPDQRRMNLLFQGTLFELAERYTNMTNLIFLTFFYSALFPIGFFLSSLALIIHYWTDKFCLLRNWARVPKLGPDIADCSGYFLMGSVGFFAVLSSYSFSGFPYDNACNAGSVVDDAYVGDYSAYDMDGREVEISVQENDPNYFYCSQDMLRYNPAVFPPIASKQPYGQKWMTGDQEQSADLLGFTALGIVVFFSLRLIYLFIIIPIMPQFFSSHEPRGGVGMQKFSEVKEICAYVPQAKLYGYPFPLILCDLCFIDNNYIGWTSPRYPHEFYSIVNDIPALKDYSVFTIVKQFVSTPALSSYGSLSSSSRLAKEEQRVI